jgi:DNA-binding ferritin-like protein (Dps family)
MNKIITTLIGELGQKRAWKAVEKRAAALPHDYLVMYKEIKSYLFTSSGLNSMEVFTHIVDLFEQSAAANIPVLEVTGTDVAAFCDELIRDESSYFNDNRNKLNARVAAKLGQQ